MGRVVAAAIGNDVVSLDFALHSAAAFMSGTILLVKPVANTIRLSTIH